MNKPQHNTACNTSLFFACEECVVRHLEAEWLKNQETHTTEQYEGGS